MLSRHTAPHNEDQICKITEVLSYLRGYINVFRSGKCIVFFCFVLFCFVPPLFFLFSLFFLLITVIATCLGIMCSISISHRVLCFIIDLILNGR